AGPGDAGTVRYLTRGRLAVVTLQMPRPAEHDGVRTIPRSSLPAHAQTAIAHVRRLLRLDEPLFSTDPRKGDPRGALFEQLDHIARDLLGARDARFLPAGNGPPAAATGPPGPAWRAH